ncbi:hypothetical protein HDU88_002676 [Geranomyces variabilis]|nr:hypothetical protein HDU88_002676 [Geranomyces variabilis]
MLLLKKLFRKREKTDRSSRSRTTISHSSSATLVHVIDHVSCERVGVIKVVHRRDGSGVTPRKKRDRTNIVAAPLMHLPTEIWQRIVSHVPDLTKFSRASKATHQLLQDLHVRRACLFGKYGIRLSLYLSYMHHRRLLSPELAQLMVRGGARIPRFMVQHIAKNYASRTNSKASGSSSNTSANASGCTAAAANNIPPLERYLLKQGHEYYGESEDFSLIDDVHTFEYLSNDLINNLDTIRLLITRYHFVPLESITPTATFRLSQLLQTDISLLDTLVHSNGLSQRLINDTLVSHLLNSSKFNQHCLHTTLSCYLSRGFTLTRSVIVTQLRSHPSDAILQVLQNLVPPGLLLSCATNVLSEFFGPSVVSFNPEVMTRIASQYRISDAVFRTVLFHPLSSLPFQTRCYEQQNPIPVWTWIVDHFGAAHRFAEVAFRDVIVWANDVRDRGLALPPNGVAAAAAGGGGGAGRNGLSLSSVRRSQSIGPPRRAVSAMNANAATSASLAVLDDNSHNDLTRHNRRRRSNIGDLPRPTDVRRRRLSIAADYQPQQPQQQSLPRREPCHTAKLILEFMDKGCVLQPRHFRPWRGGGSSNNNGSSSGSSSNSSARLSFGGSASTTSSFAPTIPLAVVQRQTDIFCERGGPATAAARREWVAALSAVAVAADGVQHYYRSSGSGSGGGGGVGSSGGGGGGGGGGSSSSINTSAALLEREEYSAAVKELRRVVCEWGGVTARDAAGAGGGDATLVGLPVTERARTWDVGAPREEGRTWRWLRGKF